MNIKLNSEEIDKKFAEVVKSRIDEEMEKRINRYLDSYEYRRELREMVVKQTNKYLTEKCSNKIEKKLLEIIDGIDIIKLRETITSRVEWDLLNKTKQEIDNINNSLNKLKTIDKLDYGKNEK
jgi:hypothetical protein